MVKYIIIHNKHEGCYDFQYYEDAATKMRLTSITINPPKIFMFDSLEQAQDFFEEYINDVDVIDIRCKKGEEVEHIDYCTCGIIELDEEENPILFYNKKNQIFLMEHGPQIFIPPQELKEDIKNLNLTNRLIRKAKSLSREQRKRYIELGKYCEDCSVNDKSDSEEDGEKVILENKKEEKGKGEDQGKEKEEKEKIQEQEKEDLKKVIEKDKKEKKPPKKTIKKTSKDSNKQNNNSDNTEK